MTPTVANLKPAISLLVVSRSRLNRRRIRMGPHMAAAVGSPTIRSAEIHSGSEARKWDTGGPSDPDGAEGCHCRGCTRAAQTRAGPAAIPADRSPAPIGQAPLAALRAGSPRL